MKSKIYILLIFFIAGLSAQLQPQETGTFTDPRNTKSGSQLHDIFKIIERGISENKVKDISPFFSSQTYFSLSNGKSGYYSANQAYYVLEDFLNIYKVISFRLNNIHADEQNPYATGVYLYDLKGKRDSANVYISLKNSGGGWKIVQITIN